MSTIKQFYDFIGSKFKVLQTLVLSLTLFGSDALLQTKFECPRNFKLRILYSTAFLFLPLIFLFILGLILRPKHSPSFISKKDWSLKYFLYIIGQAGKAPLIWFLIVLIDATYISCLMNGYRKEAQIVGLYIATLYVLLAFCIPQCRCKFVKNIMSYVKQTEYEDLMLQDVENIVKKYTEEKRNKVVQDLVSSTLDKLNPEERESLEIMDELIWQCKDKVKEMFEKTKDGKDIETGSLQVTSQEENQTN